MSKQLIEMTTEEFFDSIAVDPSDVDERRLEISKQRVLALKDGDKLDLAGGDVTVSNEAGVLFIEYNDINHREQVTAEMLAYIIAVDY